MRGRSQQQRQHDNTKTRHALDAGTPTSLGKIIFYSIEGLNLWWFTSYDPNCRWSCKNTVNSPIVSMTFEAL